MSRLPQSAMASPFRSKCYFRSFLPDKRDTLHKPCDACWLEKDLRSRSVCSTFSGVFAFLAEVSACSVRAGAAAAAVVVIMGVAATLDVFHSLVVIAVLGCRVVIVIAVANRCQLPVDIHLLALQQLVHDLANLEISRAEPGRIAVAALRLGL